MSSSAAPWTYRFLVLIAALPVALYTAQHAVRDGGWQYWWQRYAWRLPKGLKGGLSLHCSSVGEVSAALPLAQQLLQEGHPLFLSVTTPTGRRMARRLLPEVRCVYFPIDHPSVVRRWLRVLAPSAVLIMETELWPNFFTEAHDRDIALALINARLSKRTVEPPRLLRSALGRAVAQLRCILAQSASDIKRFTALGARAEYLEEVGNIKYAAPRHRMPSTAPLVQSYVLAASTHEDEEEQILKMWQTIEPHDHQLVFLPRHPRRARALYKRLKQVDPRVEQYFGNVDSTAPIQIVGSLGEAQWWICHASFVFLGGSLIPCGGHNVLEVAALGRACVVGPHTEHCAAEVEALVRAGGLRQVTDAQELACVLATWLAQPEQAQHIGALAGTHMREQTDIIQCYIDALHRHAVLPA